MKNQKRKDPVILRHRTSPTFIENRGIRSVIHTFKNLLIMGIEQVDSKGHKNMKFVISKMNPSRKMKHLKA